MEHFEDGTPNVEGKKRRSICKKLLLGWIEFLCISVHQPLYTVMYIEE